jgi:peroxiredoxin
MCLIGISSNDPVAYPDDSFEEMRKRAKLKGYVFPYLFDETQEVARAYGAVCTPDIYAFESVGGEFLLRYRGRLDDSWKDASQVRARDLARAVDCILEGQPVPADQKASMGCSIKWKK